MFYRSEEYTFTPDDLECVLTYCDEPSRTTVNTDLNFNFTWDKELTPLKEKIRYNCKDGMRLEKDVHNKNQAGTFIDVQCGNDGEWIYPDPWPKCYHNTKCLDPPEKKMDGYIFLPPEAKELRWKRETGKY